MENKVFNNFEISDYIKPLDFKTLIRLANSENTNVLLYKNNYIIFYYLIQVKHVNANGDLIMWAYVSEIYYSKVPDYHHFVFFDDVYDLFNYVDDVTDLQCKGENTKIISIMNIPDIVVDKIYDKIITMAITRG